MPELCRFFGIIVRMQCGDHPPPHFHAVYGDARASIDIEGLVVIKEDNAPVDMTYLKQIFLRHSNGD